MVKNIMINNSNLREIKFMSSAPQDGRNHRPKHVELIGIINTPLLLHLVICLYYFMPNICLIKWGGK